MYLSKLIQDIVFSYLPLFNESGAFPAGHNGPYLDPETSIRNTAHMLFLLAKAYEIEENENIKVAAEQAIEYLFSKEVRPYKAAFYCRDKEGKDHCNGLIGQAWVMEALIKASQVFGRSDCYQLAEQVFFLHKWNSKIGIWHRVEINGQELPFDCTFNHQLWFAAVAAQLNKTPIAQHRAERFLAKVAANVTLYSDGVVFHLSPMGRLFDYTFLGPRRLLGQIKRCFLLENRLSKLYSKSVGYHGFNLYAYAMLKKIFPDNSIWASDLIEKITTVVDTDSFKSELIKSKFGYFYNVSGIEIAYAMEVLCCDKGKAQAWINRQFKYTWGDKNTPLSKGVVDRNTSYARLYEITRLKNDYIIMGDK